MAEGDAFAEGFEEHVVSAAGHTHTLTMTETGETCITEHQDDPGFTLLSGCYVFKVAHRAFAARLSTPEGEKIPHAPEAGVYRIAVGDDGNLHVFGRVHPSPTEQEITS